MAMMAMTTSSSIKVKPRRPESFEEKCFNFECKEIQGQYNFENQTFTSRKGTTAGLGGWLASRGDSEQNFCVHPFPLIARLFCIVWLSGGLVTSLPAQVASNAPNFFVRVWQVEQGLPQNKVTAVVQTRDGYVWIGTSSGLARFDGVHFTVFDEKNTPQMRSSRVTALFESDDGSLWIGHENGAVTTCKNGKFQAEPVRAAWGNGKIYAITADESGDVWLLNEAGFLARVRDGQVLSPAAGTAAKLLSLARDNSGNIWVARDGKLSVMEHTQLHPFDLGTTTTNPYVQGVCARHAGGVWVTSEGHLRKLSGQTVVPGPGFRSVGAVAADVFCGNQKRRAARRHVQQRLFHPVSRHGRTPAALQPHQRFSRPTGSCR